MMEPVTPQRCPVCNAAFRDATQCPRCGGDLTPLMSIIGRAYHLRSQSRDALVRRRYAEAAHFAAQAQRLHQTDTGRKMLLATRALSMVRVNVGQDLAEGRERETAPLW